MGKLTRTSALVSPTSLPATTLMMFSPRANGSGSAMSPTCLSGTNSEITRPLTRKVRRFTGSGVGSRWSRSSGVAVVIAAFCSGEMIFKRGGGRVVRSSIWNVVPSEVRTASSAEASVIALPTMSGRWNWRRSWPASKNSGVPARPLLSCQPIMRSAPGEPV
jgi:hypothetical protein